MRRDKALRGIAVGNLFFAVGGMHQKRWKSCDFWRICLDGKVQSIYRNKVLYIC